MYHITIHPLTPNKFNGNTYTPPDSKSVIQRAIACALIKGGMSTIFYQTLSEDDHAALNIIQQLGAVVKINTNRIDIEIPEVLNTDTTIQVGESGLATRMFVPILAAIGGNWTIEGKGSLVNRNMSDFESFLPQLGLSIKSNNGCLPLSMNGKMNPQTIRIDGSKSSQYLTGLLMSYTYLKAKNVSIEVEQLNSKPYIDLTVGVMETFGLYVPKNQDYKVFEYQTTEKPTKYIKYTIEKDWSAASNFLVAATQFGPLKTIGLELFTEQADKGILQPLMESNAHSSIAPESITIAPSMKLQATHYNATHSPDLFPALAVLGTWNNGTSVIEGVSRLKNKESDRAATIVSEFAKLGIIINIQDDLMIIEGNQQAIGGIVDSCGDHRIAMACALLALKAKAPITIQNAHHVGKSYPNFFEDLAALGVTLEKTTTNE